MKKRVLAMLLAAAMIVACFAACGDDSTTSSTGGTSSAAESSSEATSSEATESSEAEPSTTAAGPDDTSETYAFTVYYNYTGWSKTWGVDEASQYMSEKFNVDVNWYGADSDPDSKLNLMVTSDDLPEAVVMERGGLNNKIARAGYFQDLSQYMYEGNYLSENVLESTRDLLKIDGVLYGIPNWPRTGATGGNYQWIVNTAIYEQLGSPAFNTLEDLHQYALAAKEAAPTSYTGQSAYPLLVTNTDNGYYVYFPFYRALGGRLAIDSYWTHDNATIQFCTDNEIFVNALKMANQWYNEGLFSSEVFTDSKEQFEEKLTNGRAALLWYDFSQDDTNNFRRIVRENSEGGTSYEVVGYSPNYKDNLLGQYPQFPAAEGVDLTFGDETGTVGWNVNCITKKAERPQRIFDLFSWMLSPEGSVNMMYGPEGGTMLESVDYTKDVPDVTLKKPQSEFTSAETDAAGAWFWAQPANSDWVDWIKYAANDKETPENKNWVVDIQANLCTYDADDPKPGQKFVTDQCTGLTAEIDDQDDIGVSRQSIRDKAKEYLPKIIMAKDEAEFNKLLDELTTFAHDNNVDEINSIYQARYDSNIETQGYDGYSDEYDVYHLKG